MSIESFQDSKIVNIFLPINNFSFILCRNDASNKDLSTYEPICIIAHAGGTMDCGHYTSYVRHGDQWYHYNDMNVAPMTEEEALSAAQMTAYLVFFVKSSSAEQDSDQI